MVDGWPPLERGELGGWMLRAAGGFTGRANSVLPLGDPPFNPEMAEHFWQSFATAAGITLHITKRAGRNTHHVIEASFKGVARCLRDAVRVEGDSLPSTKGVL